MWAEGGGWAAPSARLGAWNPALQPGETSRRPWAAPPGAFTVGVGGTAAGKVLRTLELARAWGGARPAHGGPWGGTV